MHLTYRGVPLGREVEVAFTLQMEQSGYRAARIGSKRRVAVLLLPGQRWPNEMKRGRPLVCHINGVRFNGHIVYRRMHRLVLEGRFTESVT